MLGMLSTSDYLRARQSEVGLAFDGIEPAGYNAGIQPTQQIVSSVMI
jgi:hypothetical protein